MRPPTSQPVPGVPRVGPLTAALALALVLVALIGAVRGPGWSRAPAAAAAVAHDRPFTPGRVVVVAVPGLGWDDVSASSMPTLVGLADRGATGSLSVKTIGRRTSASEAYATLGAGARATAPEGPEASGWGAGERLPNGRTAGEQARRDGREPGTAAIVVPGLPAVVDANASQHQGARIGALGAGLIGAGWGTALVANHDGAATVDRTAALALTTPAGRIDHGSVASDLTATGPDGVRRTDRGAWGTAVRALPTERVTALVEVGEVAWADAAGVAAGPRRAAVARADRLLADVVATLDPERDLLLVVAPTAPSSREQPTPIVVVGPGVAPGLVRSATTRRAGYVTLPDLAPTVLDRIGVEVPTGMAGTAITVDPRSTGGAERLAAAREAIATTRFVDRSAGMFLVTLPIVFACWSLAVLLSVVLPLGRAGPGCRAFVRWVGLGLAVVPIATFVVGGLSVRTWGQPRWFAVVFGLAALAAGALTALRPPGRGPAVIAATVWGVLVADLLAGGLLQFDTPLGNSPTVAGRFAGIGNLAFGLLAASSLVVAVTIAVRADQRDASRLGIAGAAAVFAIALVVDGAPGIGSDVGGVLTLGPVAAVTLWTLAGRQLSGRRVVAAGTATLAVLAGLAALDLSRPATSQTHLGRTASRLLDGGLGDVLLRKSDAALGSLVRSSLVWIVICSAILTAIAVVGARPVLRREAERPGGRALVLGGAVALVLGGLLNDSGVMVPAMMATVLVPAAVQVLLRPGGPFDGAVPVRADDPGPAEPVEPGSGDPDRDPAEVGARP